MRGNLIRTMIRAGALAGLSVLLFAALATALSAQTSPVATTDWPMYQHDAAHSGRTSATVFSDGPLYLQWAYSFGERVEVEAQPVISSGVIYQGVMNGELHAINATTGAAVWIAQPGGPIPHTAAVYGSRVYFGSLDGKVYALSTANGSLAWSYATGGPVMSAPAVVDGRLYIGSTDGSLYALDAATGALLWKAATGGPVVSSPAVANGKVYFGSEDLYARCVDAVDGHSIWSVRLNGAGMHNTHPVVSDSGGVVMFVTVKPGGTAYVPLEGYPGAASSADPSQTWNTFYTTHPTYRTLYYLDATTGADKWDKTNRKYVPFPIPYWGLLHPILASDGTAWFPAPAGTAGYDFALDHDDRLFKVDLTTGVATQAAGGSLPDFQLRSDEVGRHVFAGGDYLYTISEDLGVYHSVARTTRALFSNGAASGYNFGTHMDPLSPLPSLHLWRYGGAISMGGVPGASPPIVANSMAYYNSYGWLYAVGPADHGYNPATSFPQRDARSHELTYPRPDAPALDAIHAEIEQRVADIVALGASAPPLAARWEQPTATSLVLFNHEFSFEVFGFEADVVRVLAEAYPQLPAAQQASLKTYLDSFVTANLLNSTHYDFVRHCIVYGESGLQTGDTNCSAAGEIAARWWAFNPNLIGLRLYALWAYAYYTGDWSKISANWSFITGKFATFTGAYDPALGFCKFDEWKMGRLNIGAQIAAAQAVRDMAAHVGDAATQSSAQTLLTNLLNTRVALAGFVPNLYATGQRQPATIHLNPDGTIVHNDIMGAGSPYNAELIPYSAALRDASNDPSQVNWWDGAAYRVDAGIGFMYYPALSGYFPLTAELADRLHDDLYSQTLNYVKSYEVNNPWWWMSDLAHHTTGSGEHLYHSPTLAWTLFQVKARVLQEDWSTLAHQLPEPASFNRKYDLYRLQNLVTLLELGGPDLTTSAKIASPPGPSTGQTITYTIRVVNTGSSFTDTVYLTDTVPAGLSYVSGSLSSTLGARNATGAPTLKWSGVLSSASFVTITYRAQVVESATRLISNTVTIGTGSLGVIARTAAIVANGYPAYLPLALRSVSP